MTVLLVKMSSLGDVVHALPAVTDAVRARPGLVFDWVVEEAYAAIPRWHPAVRRVIPVALRRWRRSLWATIRDGEWFRFRDELRKEQYDVVLDAQGLMKSGWVASQARGPAVGRSRDSAREGLAAAFYDRRCEIDLTRTEVEQVRQLFALALNYGLPDTPADFGVDRARVASGERERQPSALLVHGAAWPNKLWAVESWIRVGQHLAARGMQVRLPWGTAEERARAEKIAVQCQGEVMPSLSVAEMSAPLADASMVVGLDTGLTHMAIAFGTPTVTLYGPSVPVYQSVAGGKLKHLTSTNSPVVDTNRKNTVPIERVLAACDELVPAGSLS